MIADAPAKARFIMVGGFLGAGKSTSLGQLGRYLTDRGLRVGLITNDQSTGLVDTRLLRSQGFDVEEIAGGCFCCRFDSLLEAADNLTATTRPDVFLAEPVGSCTDLVATVSYPLRRIYGDRFTIAPLSVLVDPLRASRVFGLSEGRTFSDKVIYIYRKQLEEADFLIINKCDAIDASSRDRLIEEMQRSFPHARVFACSAKTGDDTDDWFEALLQTEHREAATMAMDYDEYAEGEARLGWFNGTVRLTTDQLIDGNTLMLDLATRVQDQLRNQSHEIAHLKMTLESGDADGGLAVVSVVASDEQPDVREALMDQLRDGMLIINLRAEADPALLRTTIADALAMIERLTPGLDLVLEHADHFRPARPNPVHRVEVI